MPNKRKNTKAQRKVKDLAPRTRAAGQAAEVKGGAGGGSSLLDMLTTGRAMEPKEQFDSMIGNVSKSRSTISGGVIGNLKG